MTIRKAARCSGAALALLMSLAPGRVAAAQPSQTPEISMHAGGCSCVGMWTLDVTGGRLEVDVMGTPAARDLSWYERRELETLLAALPLDVPSYEFGAVYSDL